jgi:hypothetical protein
MSVWTHIEGTVYIYKKDKVSVKKVIMETLTDEACVHVETIEFADKYFHKLDCNVCIDGYDFIKKYERFLRELKPIKGYMDLECSLRFIN